MKEVLIIGGGFAGVNLAQKLANQQGVHVTLVDKNNYNFFPPLLYQVASGFLEVANITYPFRKLFAGKKNVNFRMASLQSIDTANSKVVLSNGEARYDYLVLATGTESNYFGIENIRKHGLTMKTIDDAVNIRNVILQKIEEATRSTDQKEIEQLTTIVIAGGGPTGVELAGVLAEMKKNIFKREYPELASQNVKVYLVDALPVVLAPMSEKSQKYTKEKLEEMGVTVVLNKQVKDYADNKVVFADGTSIETKLLIWTAGVAAKTFEGLPETVYAKGKRLKVDAYNKIEGTANIYAIGDTCLQTTDKAWPDGHPQLAQVAIQQGKNLARNIKAMTNNNDLKAFEYFDKGSMAIIGRNKAVAEIPKPSLKFTGFIAWMMWLFVHLFSLINFRNKMQTFFNWMITLFTKDQSMRIIVRPTVVQDKS
jgi:NADH dehydrogenase